MISNQKSSKGFTKHNFTINLHIIAIFIKFQKSFKIISENVLYMLEIFKYNCDVLKLNRKGQSSIETITYPNTPIRNAYTTRGVALLSNHNLSDNW